MAPRIHAHVSGAERTVLAEICDQGLIWLGVAAGFGEPGQCTQWCPRTVQEIRAVLGQLKGAFAADDGGAEFLMVAGIPFDCREAAALLSVIITVLGQYSGRQPHLVKAHG